MRPDVLELPNRSDHADEAIPRSRGGMTVREVAKLLRVGCDRVRAWIRSGELPAINTAGRQCDKPRFIVLPSHISEFESKRRVRPPAKTVRRRPRPHVEEFY